MFASPKVGVEEMDLEEGPEQFPDIMACEARAYHDSVMTEGNCEIHFWVYGRGPVRLALIEGLDSTHYGWEEQVVALTGMRAPDGGPMYSVFALDNRGSGRSTIAPGPYSIQMMARDTLAALDKAGWKENVNVGGLSMGGMIAQELFLLDQARFSSLILLATHAGGNLWHHIPSWGNVFNLLKASWAIDPRSRLETTARMIYSEAWLKDNFEAAVTRLERREKAGGEVFPDASKAQTDAITAFDARSKLKIIKAAGKRALAIYGTADTMIMPKFELRTAEAIGAKIVAIPGAGHQITDEAAAVVNEEIHKFLSYFYVGKKAAAPQAAPAPAASSSASSSASATPTVTTVPPASQ